MINNRFLDCTLWRFSFFLNFDLGNALFDPSLFATKKTFCCPYWMSLGELQQYVSAFEMIT